MEQSTIIIGSKVGIRDYGLENTYSHIATVLSKVNPYDPENDIYWVFIHRDKQIPKEKYHIHQTPCLGSRMKPLTQRT